jgi:hypothetical protein
MILPSSVLVSATITADPVVVLVDETEYKRIGSSTMFITMTSEESDDFAGDFVLPADLYVGSHTLRTLLPLSSLTCVPLP